jgi:hypothetical protein
MISRAVQGINLTVPAIVSMSMLTSIGLRIRARRLADETLARTWYTHRMVTVALLSTVCYASARVWPHTWCEAIPSFAAIPCDALLHLTVSLHRRFASISLTARLLVLIMEGLSRVLLGPYEQAVYFVGALSHHPSTSTQTRLS